MITLQYRGYESTFSLEDIEEFVIRKTWESVIVTLTVNKIILPTKLPPVGDLILKKESTVIINEYMKLITQETYLADIPNPTPNTALHTRLIFKNVVC